jgi:hypothetical protein
LAPGRYRVSVSDLDAFRPGGNLCAEDVVVDLAAGAATMSTPSLHLCSPSP